MRFLKEGLEHGYRKGDELIEEGAELGFSRGMMFRAMKVAGIKGYRDNIGNCWIWEDPNPLNKAENALERILRKKEEWKAEAEKKAEERKRQEEEDRRNGIVREVRF